MDNCRIDRWSSRPGCLVLTRTVSDFTAVELTDRLEFSPQRAADCCSVTQDCAEGPEGLKWLIRDSD